MKTSTLIIALVMTVVVAGAVFFLTRNDSPTSFALDHEVALLREPEAAPVAVFFAADRISAPGSVTVETKGYLEGIEYRSTSGELRLSGWSPADLQSSSSRLILRDPFGAAVPSGSMQLTTVDRPDVRRVLGDSSAASRYGFTLTVPLRESGSGSAWLRSLEVYADDGGETLFSLNDGSGHAFRTWMRTADGFELAVVFATPAYAEGATDGGHIDLVEPGAAEGTVRIHGWTTFDARSPNSLLCIRLPRAVAPAAIMARESHLRPDVPPVIDPGRPELQYGGFIVTLAISGSAEDLKKKGALALWSIKDNEAPISVHVGKLK